MKIDTMTVVPAASLIVINREAYQCEGVVLESPMPQFGAAYELQWFGERGEIRYEKGPPGRLDRTLLDQFIAPWCRARAKALRGKHDDLVRNLEITTTQIADHEVMITQLGEQLAEMDAQIESANDATRGGIVNAKTRLSGTLGRMKSELAALQKLQGEMTKAQPVAAQAAIAAEAEANEEEGV